MPTPFSFKITVTELSEAPPATRADEDPMKAYLSREIFAMAIPASDFDMPTFITALTKRKRVRKARGKETQ